MDVGLVQEMGRTGKAQSPHATAQSLETQKLHLKRGSSPTPWGAAGLVFCRSLPSRVTTPPGTNSVPTLVIASNRAWGHCAPCPQPAPPWGHSCSRQGTALLPLNPQRSAPALWVLLPITHSHPWVGTARGQAAAP